VHVIVKCSKSTIEIIFELQQNTKIMVIFLVGTIASTISSRYQTSLKFELQMAIKKMCIDIFDIFKLL